MKYVTLIKFFTKVNGEGKGYFEGRRGLRQRDPMSPLIFVLVMEYLSRVLKRMAKLSDFMYHPMSKNTKFNQLVFVDDLMLFCKGDMKSVSRLAERIQHFSMVTG